MGKWKTVRVRRESLDRARRNAKAALRRPTASDAEAVELAIAMTGDDSLQRIADAVSIRTQALAIAAAIKAMEALTGEVLTLKHDRYGEWYLVRNPNDPHGVPMGRAPVDAIAAELARAGIALGRAALQ